MRNHDGNFEHSFDGSSLVKSEDDLENNFTIGMEDENTKTAGELQEHDKKTMEKPAEHVIANPFMQVTSFNKLLKMNSVKKQNKRVSARALRKIEDEEEPNYMLSEKFSGEESGGESRSYYIKDGEVTERHYSSKK